MASRIILLPNIITHRKGPNGSEEVHTPEFLGIDGVLSFAVKTDYRDVSKVQVTAPDKVLADLHKKSVAHFDALWSRRKQDE